MSRRLDVHLPGHHVGNVEQLSDGRMSFRPDVSWEHRGQRPRLGVAFLRQPGPSTSRRGLLPWFENLLPEQGGELRRRLCAIYELREGSSFRLLEALGRDLPGAVELVGDGTEAELEQQGEPGEGEEDGLFAAEHFSSLAGMQLKFTMSMLGERLSLPARHGDEQWIVKLPGGLFPDLPRVEAATMSWARAAGFNVPDHRVVRVDQLAGIPTSWVDDVEEAFAVKRFDRRNDGTKVHHEDLCQALDLPPQHRYGDTNPRVAFDGVLRFIVDVCGEHEGREFARRLGFMIACGNDDAHLKNWSLSWGEKTIPSLSPCYDLVSTVAWEKFGWSDHSGPSLALALGKIRRFDLLDSNAVMEFAAASNRSWASEELRHGLIAAKSAWEQISQDAPASMQTAIGTHWARVPLLREIGLG